MGFSQFLSFFNKKEKNKILILFFFMVIASILETLGIGLIFPITGAILESINDGQTNYSDFFQNIFKFPKNSIILYCLILLTLVYFVKIVFMIWFSYFQFKFIYFFLF